MSDLKPEPLVRPKLAEPVLVDIFGDGNERELRYTIGSIQRLKQKLGKSMMGVQGNLLNLDEELLPVLIYEGLRHAPVHGTPCACGYHAEGGVEPDLAEAELVELPAYTFNYLLTKFSEAYTASRPNPKKTVRELPAPDLTRPN